MNKHKEREILLPIIQSYIGVIPKDKGCTNWKEMGNKMLDAILLALYLDYKGINLIPTYSEELKKALEAPLWKEHKPGDRYTMDGKAALWKITYYPLFGTFNNVKDRDGNTLEVKWVDFEEPRALVETPAVFEGGSGTDLREVPLRYLKKQ